VIDRDDVGLEIRDVRLCEIAELLSRPQASSTAAGFLKILRGAGDEFSGRPPSHLP
jgi:hypothetical protein